LILFKAECTKIKNSIIVFAHFPSFSLYDIFHFSSSKTFQTGCDMFLFTSKAMKVIANRLLLMFSFLLLLFRLFQFTLFNEVRKFLYTILYLKTPFSINKQFSIDSFHDWEGHHRVFAYDDHRLHFSASGATYSLIILLSNCFFKRSRVRGIMVDTTILKIRGCGLNLTLNLVDNPTFWVRATWYLTSQKYLIIFLREQ